MATLASVLLMPHNPLMAADREAAPARQREVCDRAFASIVARLKELNVTTVVVIGDDHYTLHGPGCIPRYMIGIGDIEGPIEQWLGIDRRRIKNNSALAEHIMAYGFSHDVDWAVSKVLRLDHSITIPIEYVVRQIDELSVVPIYINSAFSPYISNRRAYTLGKKIGEAIATWQGDERVAILGTGGLSHWVGMAEMGRVNEAWDRRVIAAVEAGDIDALLAMSDDDIIKEAGNGGLEIKNWLCALGAMDAPVGSLIAYEAIPEWISGCAFMEIVDRSAAVAPQDRTHLATA